MRQCVRTCRATILSIKPYPGVADHLGPQVEFRLDELVGFGNRQLHQGAAAFFELLPEFGCGNPCLLAQAPENFGRGASGGEQADPGFDTKPPDPSFPPPRPTRPFAAPLPP